MKIGDQYILKNYRIGEVNLIMTVNIESLFTNINSKKKMVISGYKGLTQTMTVYKFNQNYEVLQ